MVKKSQLRLNDVLVKKCSEMASEFVQILKNPGEQTQYLNSTSLDLSWGGILRDLKSQIEWQITIIYLMNFVNPIRTWIVKYRVAFSEEREDVNQDQLI